VLNLILSYGLNNFFQIFGGTSLVGTHFNIDYSLKIYSLDSPTAGIQGFFGRVFKCDKFGFLADMFFLLASDGKMIVDPFTKDVTLDDKHIRLIYPAPKNILI
jgi:hypothetical protein